MHVKNLGLKEGAPDAREFFCVLREVLQMHVKMLGFKRGCVDAREKCWV